MTRYQKLGVLAVRYMALGLFTMTTLWVLLLTAAARTMGGMMGQNGPGGVGMMDGMGAGSGLFWGPVILTFLVGVLLYALARPIGSAIGSGLQD